MVSFNEAFGKFAAATHPALQGAAAPASASAAAAGAGFAALSQTFAGSAAGPISATLIEALSGEARRVAFLIQTQCVLNLNDEYSILSGTSQNYEVNREEFSLVRECFGSRERTKLAKCVSDSLLGVVPTTQPVDQIVGRMRTDMGRWIDANSSPSEHEVQITATAKEAMKQHLGALLGSYVSNQNMGALVAIERALPFLPAKLLLNIYEFAGVFDHSIFTVKAVVDSFFLTFTVSAQEIFSRAWKAQKRATPDIVWLATDREEIEDGVMIDREQACLETFSTEDKSPRDDEVFAARERIICVCVKEQDAKIKALSGLQAEKH